MTARVQGFRGSGPWTQFVSDVDELDWKNSVKAATVAPLPANTLDGAANTLTAVADGAFPSVDGVAISLGESVLVKNEGGGTSPSNGIWVLTDPGSAGTPWVLTRRDDADTDQDVTAGMVVPVTEGTQVETAWTLATNDPIDLNVTPLTFVQFGGAPLAVAPPPDITDSTNVVGVSGFAARQDHTHAHGFRGGGSLHTLATVALAGFMSPGDKAKLDGVSTGAGPRLYDAVVDAAGGADFLLPSAAFASGARTVFVRKGVYVETANVVIPEDGLMVGEAPGGVIIMLNGGFQVQIDGSGRLTTAGTVSVATGSAAVSGAGTAFTTLLPGDYILLGDVYVPIASVTDNLNLTLSSPYRGNAVAGQSMRGQSMRTGCGMENAVLVQSPAEGLLLRQCHRCFFRAVAVQFCGAGAANPGVLLDGCGSLIFQTCAVENCGERGIRAFTSANVFYIGCVFRNNVSHGIEYDSCRACVMDGSITTQNGGDGIFVVQQSERIQLTDCIVSYNDLAGIDTGSSSSSSVIANSTIRSNGQAGIDFDGASDIVDGCLVENNGGDGIEAGDDAVVSDCNVIGNGGRGISMQQDVNCAITSSVIRNNGSHGILAGADSTITGNAISGNGGDGINLPNAADDCVVTCNRSTTNTGWGISIGNAAVRATVMANNFTGNTAGSINDLAPSTLKDTADEAGRYNFV